MNKTMDLQKETAKSTLKSKIIQQIAQHKNSDMKIATMGLKIELGDSREFYRTIDELIEGVEKIDTNNLYRFNVQVDTCQFLSIRVNALYLRENEIGLPLNLVRIARNLKALRNSNYEYSDDHSVWKFWSNLRTKLDAKIAKLSSQELTIVNQLA